MLLLARFQIGWINVHYCNVFSLKKCHCWFEPWTVIFIYLDTVVCDDARSHVRRDILWIKHHHTGWPERQCFSLKRLLAETRTVEYSSGGDCNTITKLIGKTMFLASVHHNTFTCLPRAEVSTDGHDMNEVTALQYLAALHCAFISLEQRFVMSPTQRVHVTTKWRNHTECIHMTLQPSQRIIWGQPKPERTGSLLTDGKPHRLSARCRLSGVTEREKWLDSQFNTVWIRLDVFNYASRFLNHNVPKSCHTPHSLSLEDRRVQST